MAEAAAAIATGEVTATDLLERCIAEIEAHNDALNAFVHLDLDGARAAAADVDARIAAVRRWVRWPACPSA